MLEPFKELIALLGLIVFTITREWWKDRKEKLAQRPDTKAMVNTLSIDLEIDKVLDDIRFLTGANRAHILMFHNGIVSYAGDHFDYCTMTHERLDTDSTSLLLQYQRVPCAPFRNDMLKIAKDGYIGIHSGEDSTLAVTHSNFGILSSYKFRIGDALRNGVVAVSWRRNKELSQRQIEDIQDLVAKIKMLLDLKRSKGKI